MFKLVATSLRKAIVPQMVRQNHAQKIEHTVGSCGIPPFKEAQPQAPPPNAPNAKRQFKLPEHLIRPPCIPGSTPGVEQTCMLETKGMYCTPIRAKYRYPSFSENMNVIPGDGKVCWWFRTRECNLNASDPLFYERPDVEVHA